MEEQGYKIQLEGTEQMNLEEKLGALKEEITKFFSESEIQSEIKSLYDRIRHDKEFAMMEFTCEDLNTSLNIYNEYLNGMVKFLTETTVSADAWGEKFALAKQTMPEFVESIFHGGSKNKFIQETVSDGVADLELLINFIPQMDNFVTEGEQYKDYKGHELYEESVYEFSKLLIESTINKFNQMVMLSKPTQMQESVKPRNFKLFL